MTTDALTFFEENQAYVAAYGLSNLDREDRTLYRKGKQMIEDAIRAAKGTRELYSDSEAAYLVKTYLTSGGDMQATRAAYFNQYPDGNHSASSVWMKISRIRTLDTQFETDTEWQTDRQIESICQALDPERFGF